MIILVQRLDLIISLTLFHIEVEGFGFAFFVSTCKRNARKCEYMRMLMILRYPFSGISLIPICRLPGNVSQLNSLVISNLQLEQ